MALLESHTAQMFSGAVSTLRDHSHSSGGIRPQGMNGLSLAEFDGLFRTPCEYAAYKENKLLKTLAKPW